MRKSVILVISIMLVSLIPVQTSAISMDQGLGSADVVFNAWSAGGNLGYDVAIVGDVNSDGIDDIVMTDNTNDSSSGNAYLFFGTGGTWNPDPAQANVTFWTDIGGPISNVFPIGDVNSDGRDDFILGAPGQDNPQTDAGSAYLFFGRSIAWNKYHKVTNSNATVNGTQANDRVGEIVAGLGDVNGDGRDDFAIGTPGRDTDRGYAWLFTGKRMGWNRTMNLNHARASYYGQEDNAFAGYSVAGGDVNGDGLGDMIIGAPGNDAPAASYQSPGYVYLVFGMEDGWSQDVNLSDDANASLKGEYFDDYAGQSVACVGDVDDDGFDDILVGTTRNDEVASRSGKAYLYMGYANGWTTNISLSNADASFRGEAASDMAGASLAPAGDVNGDGLDDFLIGAPMNDDGGLTDQGQVYFYYGKTSGWTTNSSLANADGSWLGEGNSDGIPEAMSGGGDVNDDVLDDLLFGSTRGANRGRAYLVFPVPNAEPTNPISLGIYSDEALTTPISYASMEQPLYIKLTATDSDPGNVNFAEVRVTSWPGDWYGFHMILRETGTNTGIFTGNFSAQNYTHESHRWIEAPNGNRVYVTSTINNSIRDAVSIGGGITVDRLWLHDKDDNILYAEAEAYHFRTNVSDTLRHEHIHHVNLSLPLASGTINFTWTEETDTFQETQDPMNYARLANTSHSYTSQWNRNRVALWFDIAINFTFPDELLHPVEVTAITDDNEVAYLRTEDFYQVENDLDFHGDLRVESTTGKLLHDGDVLGTGMDIVFTNSVVVYEGTTESSPHDDFFDVLVEDDDGRQWIDEQSSGAFFHITANVSNVTDDTEDFNVTIVGVPPSCVPNNLTVSFKVDGDGVWFSEPTPSPNKWHASKAVTATINITDVGASMVKATSIEYSIKLNGEDWGSWTNAQLLGNSPIINATAMLTLNDGPENKIQWRAEDVAGNRDPGGNKTTSEEYTIMVDTVPPAFEDAYPLEGTVHKELNVTFGLNLSDIWSLVDGSSIEYTISTDNKTTWSNWVNVGHTGSGSLYECEASAEFLNGTENYVRWRASDMLANSLTSDPIQVIIDTSGPPPANIDPVLEPISDQEVKVGSNLMYQVKASDIDGNYISYILVDGPEGLTLSATGLIIFSPKAADEGVHNVTVRVEDSRDGFNVTSFKVTVTLDRPTITVTNPNVLSGELKGSVYVQGTSTPGVGQVRTVQYQIDGGTWTDARGTDEWVLTLDTTKLTDGDHVIAIRARDDGSSSIPDQYNFTVKNEKKTKPPVDTGLGDMLYIIIAVIVVIIVVVVVIVVMKMRKKTPPTDETQYIGTTTTQAATTEAYQQQPPPEEQYQHQQEEQYSYDTTTETPQEEIQPSEEATPETPEQGAEQPVEDVEPTEEETPEIPEEKKDPNE